MAVPANMWECPVCGDFVDKHTKICPNCDRQGRGFVKQPEAFSSFASRNTESKTEEKWVMQPAHTSDGSWAAKFLKVIAGIEFVGGAIASFVIANNVSYDFDWAVFLGAGIAFAVSGCLTLCASELFENIQRIADSLQRMEIRKK